MYSSSIKTVKDKQTNKNLFTVAKDLSRDGVCIKLHLHTESLEVKSFILRYKNLRRIIRFWTLSNSSGILTCKSSKDVLNTHTDIHALRSTTVPSRNFTGDHRGTLIKDHPIKI